MARNKIKLHNIALELQLESELVKQKLLIPGISGHSTPPSSSETNFNYKTIYHLLKKTEVGKQRWLSLYCDSHIHVVIIKCAISFHSSHMQTLTFICQFCDYNSDQNETFNSVIETVHGIIF